MTSPDSSHCGTLISKNQWSNFLLVLLVFIFLFNVFFTFSSAYVTVAGGFGPKNADMTHSAPVKTSTENKKPNLTDLRLCHPHRHDTKETEQSMLKNNTQIALLISILTQRGYRS